MFRLRRDYALCKPPRCLRVQTFSSHRRGDRHAPRLPSHPSGPDHGPGQRRSGARHLLRHRFTSNQDIDILVLNSGLFYPAPSLASLVINKYKLRSNIKSLNLSGMGCGAGLISLDLAKAILECKCCDDQHPLRLYGQGQSHAPP